MDISNVDDAFLDARSKFETWKAEFESQWNMPRVRQAARFTWQNQPQEIKDAVKKQAPEQVKQFEKFIAIGGRK